MNNTAQAQIAWAVLFNADINEKGGFGMTESFLQRAGVDPRITVIATYNKADIIETCLFEAATGEGNPDWMISTATMYTHSMFYEMLENVKNVLLQLVQKVLSLINNYYLNNVNLLDKYREAILDRLGTVSEPIRQETYEYPELKDYPKLIDGSVGPEKEIIKLTEYAASADSTSEGVAARVDRLLERFGKDVVGSEIDPYDINGSTRALVQEKIRGSKVTITIDRATLRKYIDSVSHYKKDKDEILRAKKAIIADYEALKRTYKSVTANPVKLAKNNARVIADPEREAFLIRETQRYADIHVELMRLFNGYIAIYRAAFDTKLAELDARIINNRNTITEIIMRTGLFTTLNTKNPDKNRKPIPYNPVNLVK